MKEIKVKDLRGHLVVFQLVRRDDRLWLDSIWSMYAVESEGYRTHDYWWPSDKFMFRFRKVEA